MLRHLVNLFLLCLPVTHFFALRRALLNSVGVSIGKNVSLCGHGWIYGRGELFVGANTWISPRVLFYTHEKISIEIGENCDIGHGVVFVPGGHEIGSSERRAGTGTAAPIRIGRGCWIGAHSVILGGADIRDGAIVAAGSLVRGLVERNTLVAGTPARPKRLLSPQ